MWLYEIIGGILPMSKMPWCRCVEHGLEYITLYVKKYIAHFGGLFWIPAGSRRDARDAHICEIRLFDESYRM